MKHEFAIDAWCASAISRKQNMRGINKCVYACGSGWLASPGTASCSSPAAEYHLMWSGVVRYWQAWRQACHWRTGYCDKCRLYRYGIISGLEYTVLQIQLSCASKAMLLSQSIMLLHDLGYDFKWLSSLLGNFKEYYVWVCWWFWMITNDVWYYVVYLFGALIDAVIQYQTHWQSVYTKTNILTNMRYSC